MSKVRILAFVDNATGRDTEILLPVGHGLQNYCHAQVKYEFVWNLLKLKTWQPDVLLLPNTRGHHMYVEAAHYAYEHGIPILALDSEGNFGTDFDYDIWGYNTGKKVYQEWVTCWSTRTAAYVSERLQEEDRKKIVITGGVGFDRYIFGSHSTREEVLARYGKKRFEKVVGYAGWAFGKLYNSQRKNSYKRLFNGDQEKAYLWVEEQRVFVREALKQAIERYSDTLFILKKHPKEEFEDELKEGKNEMNELLEYENVLYLKNEESIQDLISICDIWCGFETTTLFEAWALKKPTILLNQTTDFSRSPHYKGAIIAKSGDEMISLVQEFYEQGNLDNHISAEILKYRTETIKSSIGYADGLNHLRSLYYFVQSVPSHHVSRKFKTNFRHLRLFLLMHLGRFFYNKWMFQHLPKFSKTIYVFENRDMPGFEKRKQQVYDELNKFHRKIGITSLLKEGNWESLHEVL